MWELRVDSSLDAWAVVPAPDENERRQTWADTVARTVEANWNADEDPRFSELLVEVLEQLQQPRPDIVIADLVAWPIRSPFPVRVSFLLTASDESADWASYGFEASPYLQGPFGEGMQYSRRTPSEAAEGPGETVDSVIVFDRTDVALHLRVHPCPLEVYILSSDAIAELIDGCVLTDSTGKPFTTGKSDYRVLGDSDQWPNQEGSISV